MGVLICALMSVCSSQRDTGMQGARNAALVLPESWEQGISIFGEGQDFSGCFNHEPGQIKTF